MTEFEQQVAVALDAAMVGGIAGALAEGRLTPGELLAPRVVAAIEAFREVVEYAAEQRGDSDEGVDAWKRECERALAALRGET